MPVTPASRHGISSWSCGTRVILPSETTEDTEPHRCVKEPPFHILTQTCKPHIPPSSYWGGATGEGWWKCETEHL